MCILSVRPAIVYGNYSIVIDDGHDGVTILSIEESRRLLRHYDGNAGFDINYDKLNDADRLTFDEIIAMSINPDDLDRNAIQYVRTVKEDMYPHNGYEQHYSMID